MLQRRATAVQPSNLHQLFGVGALAHHGLLPFIGGLCGDHSPHRTTMTQTKRCPIFKFGSWWCLTVHLLVFYGGEHFFREYPVELDLLLPCSFEAFSLILVVLQRVPPRYGRRPGQPLSSTLARRVCVQSPTTSFPRVPLHGHPEVHKTPLAPIVGQRGDGDVGASPRSACELYVRCALPVCSLCLIMFSFPQCRLIIDPAGSNGPSGTGCDSDWKLSNFVVIRRPIGVACVQR